MAGSNRTALSLIPRCTTMALIIFLACGSREGGDRRGDEDPEERTGARILPIFYRFGWGGIESPEFRAALVAAYRYVGMEDMAIRYESYEPKFRQAHPAV